MTIENIEKSRKITSGTLEWADYNINCISGCSHNCRYCYAKKKAIQFKRKTEDNWKDMIVNEKKVNKGYRLRYGKIGMFPSSHDITPKVLQPCFKVLKKLIDSGNQILLTSKPHYEVIEYICDNLRYSKDQIQFRFTIGSKNDNILKFWEPGATSFKERFKSLEFAYENGFKTSLSLEPFLTNPISFIDKFEDIVTGETWIGPMGYIKASGIPDSEINEYKRVRSLYSKDNLQEIYKNLSEWENIKFKDRFRKKIGVE